ncbi:MAG: RNA polymerase II transcription factor B subunit 4 [Alyxoria varia]|nr:MAG: RNA polymerase II transcription factor B subunit 4 [Alyxoria varia]
MDAIAGGDDQTRTSKKAPPSLLTVILDTNPLAWQELEPVLTLHTAIAQLLVFVNAHLAFNNHNKVAIMASCWGKNGWLYPPSTSSGSNSTASKADGLAKDGEKPDKGSKTKATPSAANKYGPFATVEKCLLSSLDTFLSSIKVPSDNAGGPMSLSSPIAGALSKALGYINRQMLIHSPAGNPYGNIRGAEDAGQAAEEQLTARVLVVSTSGDLATQYIPLMNSMFAAQHARIPIDILKLAGDSALLQQTSFTTGGVYIHPEGLPDIGSAGIKDKKETGNAMAKPVSLLQYLMYALLADSTARRHLHMPTNPHVDLRAACFCHRTVQDLGLVCSVCLSIFCEDGDQLMGAGEGTAGSEEKRHCLTCGTQLAMGTGKEDLAGVLDEEGGGKKKDKKKKKDKDKGKER